MKKILSIVACGLLLGTGFAAEQTTALDDQEFNEQTFSAEFGKRVNKMFDGSAIAELSLLKAGQYFEPNAEICKPPLVNDEEIRAQLDKDLSKESQALVQTFFAAPLYQSVKQYIQQFVTLTLNSFCLDSKNSVFIDKNDFQDLQALDCYYPDASTSSFSWKYLYEKDKPIGIAGKLRQVRGLYSTRSFKVMVDVTCDYLFIFKRTEKRMVALKSHRPDDHQSLADQDKDSKKSLGTPTNVVMAEVTVEPHSLFRGCIKFLCNDVHFMDQMSVVSYTFDAVESDYEKIKADSLNIVSSFKYADPSELISLGGYVKHWFITVPNYDDLRGIGIEPFKVVDFVINKQSNTAPSDIQPFLNQEQFVVGDEHINEKK